MHEFSTIDHAEAFALVMGKEIIDSCLRSSRHLLLMRVTPFPTRVTLDVREPPARRAACQAKHVDVRTASCAWSREVKHAFNSFSAHRAHTYMHFRFVLLFMQINVRYAI